MGKTNESRNDVLTQFPLTMDDYAATHTDVHHWAPVVRQITDCHGLSAEPIRAGAAGTFPTFIVDDRHVVKLFGPHFAGAQAWATELEVASLLAPVADRVPTPEVTRPERCPGSRSGDTSSSEH